MPASTSNDARDKNSQNQRIFSAPATRDEQLMDAKSGRSAVALAHGKPAAAQNAATAPVRTRVNSAAFKRAGAVMPVPCVTPNRLAVLPSR